MLSKRIIKKLANDTPLNNMQDNLLTYDIDLTEKLKRSCELTDFWVKKRCKYYRAQKRLAKANIKFLKSIFNVEYILLQFKAVCDGKEVTEETIEEYGLEDCKEILKVVSGIEKSLYK